MSKNREDIIQELRELSPFLLEHRKVDIFSVPKDYFGDLSTQLVSHLEQEHNVSALFDEEKDPEGFSLPPAYFSNLSSSIIEQIKAEKEEVGPYLSPREREEGFIVPDGYFASLSDRIIEKIKEEKSSAAVTIPLWKRIRPLISVAAVLGILVFAAMQFLQPATDSELNVSQEAAFAYFLDNPEEVNEDLLADLSTEELEEVLLFEEEQNLDGIMDDIFEEINEEDLESFEDFDELY